MQPVRRIAVVGGGPAGAFAAAELSRAGREVLLFDEKLAWEKPCGGGLTDKAIARWPFLRDAPAERNWIRHCELIAPSGRTASFQLDREIAIFSRLALNGLLLDQARDAGAYIRPERILRIEKSEAGWNLGSHSGSYDADFVVLAAGARNSLRGCFSSSLGPENFMVAGGYYIPGRRSTVQIKFLKGLHGYIWSFPRADHCSVGICGRMQGMSTAELRRLLEASLPELGFESHRASFYAHIIPSLTPDALGGTHISGDGWAMVGDATGFVDAITGEGLYYALRSAELFSGALLANAPESYPNLVTQDFLSELEIASRIAERFYSGSWLGGSVIERMVQLTTLSAGFRGVMQDLFAGTQEYADLRHRVSGSLPRILVEALVSAVWKNPQPEEDAGGETHFAGAGNRT